MDFQQKLVTVALLVVAVMVAHDATAGEPGSTEPIYGGIDRDYPVYGKPDPHGNGNDYNIQIGDSANENHIEESIDLPHASDTNI